jgi:hypothetical protein
MLDTAGVSTANKQRIQDAITTLFRNTSTAAAAAARKRKTRKQAGGTKEDQIVHCLSQLKRFAPCIQTQPLRAYQFFYNLGRVQELVGDTEHPERWWKPIEALVEKGKYSELVNHIDTLKTYLKVEYDMKTVEKGC